MKEKLLKLLVVIVVIIKNEKKNTETEPNNHLPVYVSVSNLLASFKQRTLVRPLSLSL